jgi:UDP-N-acetylglucosamine 4,6-dehydratase/5-epimerase
MTSPDKLSFLAGKTVLVTGAAGTVGEALVSHIAVAGATSVRALDHGESELFHLFERLRHLGNVAPFIGDIRDLERMRMATAGADIVFHAAALKHVELGEYNPFEVVETNLRGLNNVIRAALDSKVEKVIFTSSDKAVNPTNVMGASKMMGERLVTAANGIRGAGRTVFTSVRFGNVLGSRGSVIPIFAHAALRGQPLQVTHADMTRYVMTVAEAARLVLEAASIARGGEVFVTKMRAIQIEDLARVVAEELRRERQSDVLHTQPRMGEKLYEELIAQDEIDRTLETERLLIVLAQRESELQVKSPTPESYGVEVKKGTREWHSGRDTCLTIEQLRHYLRVERILEPWRSA